MVIPPCPRCQGIDRHGAAWVSRRRLRYGRSRPPNRLCKPVVERHLWLPSESLSGKRDIRLDLALFTGPRRCIHDAVSRADAAEGTQDVFREFLDRETPATA